MYVRTMRKGTKIMGKSYYKKRYNRRRPEGYVGALRTMLPAVLMVGLVPMLVRQYQYENRMSQYAWFGGAESSVDFFLAWKSFVLMGLAFVMAGCVLYRFLKEKRKISFTKIVLPLFAYGILAFLSACCSVNRSFSFGGGVEQFETVWALLSYVLIVYYVFLYAEGELELQVVTDALCFGATVVGVLGTLQGIGLDLFATIPFQKLITTKEFLDSVGGTLGVRFGGNQAVTTMYNPNYVGVFGSLMVPFLTMMLVYEKDNRRRIWHGGNLVLVIITLLSSRSRAGLIAAIAAICVALAFAVRKLLKWWFLAIPAVNFAVVLVLLVNAYNDNIIFDRLKNILKPDDVTVAEETAEDGTVIRKTGLTEMYTTPDGVAFRYNEISAHVTFYMDESIYGFYALDEAGNQLELPGNEDGTEFSFTHPALAGVKVSPVIVGNRMGMRIQADGEWNFVYNGEKGSYQYITAYGEESDMIKAESFGFENRQRSFSGRGFIWSRTLPLLKDHLFIGSGPDTFVLEFPHEDYLGMKRNGFGGMLMTKPHSWYLQMGVQTGVLSALCVLVFYVWYAVQSLRLYAFRKLSTQTEAFGMAAFIGSIGYMISGISNDSMVVTAPIFWGMMGVGVAANVMVKKNREKEKA